jgi:hypothetical protein
MDPTAIEDVVGLRDDVEAAYQQLIEIGTGGGRSKRRRATA